MHHRRPALRLRGLSILVVALGLLPRPALAQYATGFVPYFGKNKVHYDTFAWRIYKSPHFEVFYYPEFEQHLSRLTSYLESGYQKLSAGLKHEMPEPIPAILYKTHSEFEETNLFPTFLPEGVLAFAEPTRGRLLLPIDEPPDRLNGLIQHELTHVFAFNMIPRGLFQRGIPLWIDEGLAEYFRGLWDPLDLMMIRDAAITDQVPKLSRAEFEAFSGRLVYNMGHACFEYMEARYGKEGVRQFLYTLRKGILGGSVDDIYQQAFRMSPEEFDAGFDKWLKERFKPFRDKQRPDDYGKDLSPEPGEDALRPGLRVQPRAPRERWWRLSPRTAADGEADIVLLSTKDGVGDPEPHERLHQPLREHLVQRRPIRGQPLDQLRSPGRYRGLLRPGRQAADALPGVRRSTERSCAGSPSPSTRPRPPRSCPEARKSCSWP